MRWIALLSIVEAIVADDDVAVEMMEMGKMFMSAMCWGEEDERVN